MTDTNSTTTDALDAGAQQTVGPQSGVDAGSSEAPAQPSNPENAESKDQAGASLSADLDADCRLVGLVSQDVYDSLKAEFETLKQDYASAHAAFTMAARDRDETKAYAANLAEQLATKQAAAAAPAGPTPTTIFANAEEEIAALKQRIHDGLADVKAAGERYADLVHERHPARTLSQFVSSTFAHARELLRLS